MAKKNKLTEEDNELLAELGIEVVSKKAAQYTKLEERIITGFEEIQKFVSEHGRLPEHGEDKDIFERIYAVRLERIRTLDGAHELLFDMDHQNLLNGGSEGLYDSVEDLDDEELLAQLGVEQEAENSLTNLKHVKSRAEKRAVEEVANRTPCADFETFKPLFEEVKKDIESGYKQTIQFRKDAGYTKGSIKEKLFVIVGGQIAYIANVGEQIKAPNGDTDARLRVIYDNGTESNILLRSLLRAMYKDDTSRFVSETNQGTIFSGEVSESDQESGTIYVLRSLSDHPIVEQSREVIHKIGVTGGDVKKRVANAINDPTFLMADVEIIATYKLANINRTKLESVIHKFFGKTKLEIEIIDRFGKPVKATEWFLVPLFVIDEVVSKIMDGTIGEYRYDHEKVELKRYTE